MKRSLHVLLLGALLVPFAVTGIVCPDPNNFPPIDDGQAAAIAGCPGVAQVFNALADIVDLDSGLNPASVVITTDVLHGTLVNNFNGTVSYTPDNNFSGYDFFEFTVEDNAGNMNRPFRFDIFVRPTGVADSFSIVPNVPVKLDVLANDCGNFSNTGGQKIKLQLVTAPTEGTLYRTQTDAQNQTNPLVQCNLVDTSNGQAFWYRLNNSSSSEAACVDHFEYRIVQILPNFGGTLTSLVTPVTVGLLPDANDDSATAYYFTPVEINVLQNDVVPCDDICVNIVSYPCHGTVEVLPNNKILYSPCEGFYGNDSFVYQLCTNCSGQESFCDTAVVNIKVLSCLQTCLALQVPPCNNCTCG